MPNKITVRPGEKPLLVIDGTDDGTKLWLYDPKQNAYFCYERERQYVLTKFYRYDDIVWISYSVEPNGKWEPVYNPITIRLLMDMQKAVITWLAYLCSPMELK
jgi:hypothetical protein